MPDPVLEIIDSKGKTQLVRLLDVFVLGPLMIWAAANHPMREPQRTLLFLTGVGTILYNGANYLNIRDADQDQAGI